MNMNRTYQHFQCKYSIIIIHYVYSFNNLQFSQNNYWTAQTFGLLRGTITRSQLIVLLQNKVSRVIKVH